jgi:glycosyltransferase involved in cell wall biosynthesis
MVKSFNNDIVVLSHLRWDFVFQRPQHLISRLAKDRKILFVEEPKAFMDENQGTAHIYKDGNVTVLQPEIKSENFDTDIALLINEYIARSKLNNPILWFYSPAFIKVADKVDHSLIVFDCMDQLTAFKGAPSKLIDQEMQLLSIADIVFTGGKSLYEEKSQHHNNVYCFPSSVDEQHFAKAIDRNTEIPDDIKNIAKPVVGYYGVIDERIDLHLLKEVSEKLQDTSFVMIGPVVKIDQNDLPKADNIHYLGQKDYSVLPNYLKAIDVAIMPFALNESTKFISPTKTLEYMAAQTPIVSTQIYDVVRDYKGIVKIAVDAREFANCIVVYLRETAEEKKLRLKNYKQVLSKTTWDKTIAAMKEIIADILKNKKTEVKIGKQVSALMNM